MQSLDNKKQDLPKDEPNPRPAKRDTVDIPIIPGVPNKAPAVLEKPFWILLMVFLLAFLVDRIVFYHQTGA